MKNNIIKNITFLACFSLTACASNANSSLQLEDSSVTQPSQEVQTSSSPYTISPQSEWYPLYMRLQNDGFYGPDVDDYFERLEGSFSQVPMGIKMKELYNIKFKKRTPTQGKTKPIVYPPHPSGVPQPWYKGFVTEETAQKGVQFIEDNKLAFENMEKRYGIPKEVIAALLYVETKHGTFLGQHNPIVNLASMANSTNMNQIPDYIEKLPKAKENPDWVHEKMKEKSDWSYKELQALITYCRENNQDPFTLPSSVYGALGYGQFMPTNIPLFAVDGDNDDIINLFTPADALMSTANYLYKHGWNKPNLTLAQKTKIIKRYNWSNMYAHTILALAYMIEQAETKTR